MSGEGECLYYWVQSGLDSIRHDALTTVREAYEILTGPKEPAVKPDDCPYGGGK